MRELVSIANYISSRMSSSLEVIFEYQMATTFTAKIAKKGR